MDDLDILTLEEAKTAVNLSQSRVGNEEALELAVTAVSRVIDDRRGPVVVRSVTETHVGGWGFIVPREQPVYSVTTLTEYNSTTPTVLAAEDFPGTVTSNDYALVDGVIYRRSSGWDSTFAGGRIIVTYQAGRYATTETVDEQYKKAASEILSGNWQKFAAAWARGGDAFADPVFFDEVTNTLNRWVPQSELGPVLS